MKMNQKLAFKTRILIKTQNNHNYNLHDRTVNTAITNES